MVDISTEVRFGTKHNVLQPKGPTVNGKNPGDVVAVEDDIIKIRLATNGEQKTRAWLRTEKFFFDNLQFKTALDKVKEEAAKLPDADKPRELYLECDFSSAADPQHGGITSEATTELAQSLSNELSTVEVIFFSDIKMSAASFVNLIEKLPADKKLTIYTSWATEKEIAKDPELQKRYEATKSAHPNITVEASSADMYFTPEKSVAPAATPQPEPAKPAINPQPKPVVTKPKPEAEEPAKPAVNPQPKPVVKPTPVVAEPKPAQSYGDGNDGKTAEEADARDHGLAPSDTKVTDLAQTPISKKTDLSDLRNQSKDGTVIVGKGGVNNHEDVKTVQNVMIKAGLMGDVPEKDKGRFGPKSEAGLKEIQKLAGLKDDGKASRLTLAALDAFHEAGGKNGGDKAIQAAKDAVRSEVNALLQDKAYSKDIALKAIDPSKLPQTAEAIRSHP